MTAAYEMELDLTMGVGCVLDWMEQVEVLYFDEVQESKIRIESEEAGEVKFCYSWHSDK